MKFIFVLPLWLSLLTWQGYAHESAKARYLGNEGVLIDTPHGKVLFDPFFHNSYGTYQLVPEVMRNAIFSGQSPYDNIQAIIISHAHGDHFSGDNVMRYLKTFPQTKLIAPQQAITRLYRLAGSADLSEQLVAVDLALNDPTFEYALPNIKIEGVRIPHAGWPGRADVENIVFRVSLGDDITVMHLGDADVNDAHYLPYDSLWQKQITGTAFPPYWFLTSQKGKTILTDRLKVKHAVGVHVPVIVPAGLKAQGEDYFSKPGEERSLMGHE